MLINKYNKFLNKIEKLKKEQDNNFFKENNNKLEIKNENTKLSYIIWWYVEEKERLRKENLELEKELKEKYNKKETIYHQLDNTLYELYIKNKFLKKMINK